MSRFQTSDRCVGCTLSRPRLLRRLMRSLGGPPTSDGVQCLCRIVLALASEADPYLLERRMTDETSTIVGFEMTHRYNRGVVDTAGQPVQEYQLHLPAELAMS